VGALVLLARKLYAGADGFPCNRARAAELFRRAADLVPGSLVPADTSLTAAAQGSVEAAVDLAVMLEDGAGVGQDLAAAAQLFMLASERVRGLPSPTPHGCPRTAHAMHRGARWRRSASRA
jgi:TPR repeat protein